MNVARRRATRARFARPAAGQSDHVYWTFAFVWRGEDVDEDVDRFPPAQPGFHYRPPTR